MICKKCGKEIADSPFCQYCGGKQDINTNANNVKGPIDDFINVTETMQYDKKVSISKNAFTTTAASDWTTFDENADYTIDQLNNYIQEGVAILQKMADDFPKLTKFSHYSQFAAVLTPGGLLGCIREGIQNKKLQRYLGTKIYNNMAYDELGDFMVKAAEDLSKAQIKLQKALPPSDPIFYGNTRIIMNVFLKCLAEWKEIAPEVYNEEITFSTGDTVNLGDQTEFWIHKELVNMELPKDEYKEVKKNVKDVTNNSGCLLFIGILFITSLITACTLL